MIQGIGTDIIEIERIKKAMMKPGFLRRCFTEAEIAYFESKGMRAESVAGGFAAKEAISKAMGTGFGRLSWTDIEIVRNEQGRPEVRLSNHGGALAEEQNISAFQISISHCREYAVAFCLAERG